VQAEQSWHGGSLTVRWKPFVKQLIGSLLSATAVVLAPLVRVMAYYGFGSRQFLQRGVLPLPVHYYSPVPDVPALEKRKVWSHRSDLPGVDFNAGGQLAMLERLGTRFGRECAWPLKSTGDPTAFNLDNTNFSYGCAAALHCMLRDARCTRVIEIGSGNSSKVIAGALAMNAKETGLAANYIMIDPNADAVMIGDLPWPCRVLRQCVEVTSLDCFLALGDGDLLFIDSGHTVRIGGDVNFLFIEVIPRLAAGVLVHIHDVNLPYEYERVYATGTPGTYPRLWTEAYLLQAFLAHNADWEVLLGMRYLLVEQEEACRRAFPHYDPTLHRNVSSSFWMRRRKATV